MKYNNVCTNVIIYSIIAILNNLLVMTMKINNLILGLEDGSHWVGTENSQRRIEVKQCNNATEIVFHDILVTTNKDGEILSAVSRNEISNNDEIKSFINHLINTTDIF